MPTKKKAVKKAPKMVAKPKDAFAVDGAKLIDRKIADVGGWRGDTLARMRGLIKEAVPDVVEDCKWFKPSNPTGVPTWSKAGLICTGEVYKAAVKLTFMYGASVPDPARLFNASMDAGTRRAIDIPEGTKLDATAFKALMKAAVAVNESKGR